jgi:hypothetical protein
MHTQGINTIIRTKDTSSTPRDRYDIGKRREGSRRNDHLRTVVEVVPRHDTVDGDWDVGFVVSLGSNGEIELEVISTRLAFSIRYSEA